MNTRQQRVGIYLVEDMQLYKYIVIICELGSRLLLGIRTAKKADFPNKFVFEHICHIQTRSNFCEASIRRGIEKCPTAQLVTSLGFLKRDCLHGAFAAQALMNHIINIGLSMARPAVFARGRLLLFLSGATLFGGPDSLTQFQLPLQQEVSLLGFIFICAVPCKVASRTSS